MSLQQNKTARPVIARARFSAALVFAALALSWGADALAIDRYRCIPADGSEPYTSPGTCRANTTAREALTEQEIANTQAIKRRGRAFIRCTAVDGSYSRFAIKDECPSATDIRTEDYAKQPIQQAQQMQQGTPNSATNAAPLTPQAPTKLGSSSAVPSVASSSVASPSANQAGLGTGGVIKLGLIALIFAGLGVAGIFKFLGHRYDKAQAKLREARDRAIEQRRTRQSPVKDVRPDQTAGDRGDIEQQAQDFLAALKSGADVKGGLAFKSELQAARLDYSMDSLARIDLLLPQLRAKFSPTRESWQNQPGADNFCLMLAFYLGEMISRQANQPIKWYTREQAAPFMPADMPVPVASWSRVVGIIAASACVPLAVIEDTLFGDSPEMTCKTYVEHRLAKLPKPPAKDENERCAQMLEAFFNDTGIVGGLTFREQLSTAQLDYSLASLHRVDQLLRSIRAEIKPDYAQFVNTADTQSFLRLVAFYIGMTTARVGAASVKWLSFAEAKKDLPDLEFQFETTSVCLLGGRFYFLLGLVTEILLQPDPQRTVPGWASAVIDVAPPKIESILQSSGQSATDTLLDEPTALAIRKAGFVAAWCMFMVEGGSPGALTAYVPGEGGTGTFIDFSMYGDADSAFKAANSRMETNPQNAPFQVMSFDGYANLPTGRTDALTIELRLYPSKQPSNQRGLTMSVACPYRNAGDPKGFAIFSPKLLECSAPAAMNSAIFKHFYLGIKEYKSKEFDWFKFLDERI